MKNSIQMYLSIILPLLISLLLMGCTEETITYNTNASSPTEIRSSAATTNRRLRLSVVNDENMYYKHILPEELGPSYTDELLYYGFSDIFIEIDGDYINLVTAIKEELITPEEIIAYAKIDARNKQCEMKFQSSMGYAQYGYLYEDFEIVIVYDVFETTVGEQYHVESLTFGNPGYFENTTYCNPKILKDGIEQEENVWGVTFEVVEATPCGAAIRCAWTSDQEMRQLQVIDYVLLCNDGYDNWQLCPLSDSSGDFLSETIILQQSDFDVSLDWSKKYGKLSNGNYRIHMLIEDIQKEENGVSGNDRNRQWYSVTFDIAE